MADVLCLQLHQYCCWHTVSVDMLPAAQGWMALLVCIVS